MGAISHLPRKYSSIADAAGYAAVSEKTIRRWIASGRINGYRAGSRIIRVDLNEIDAALRPIPNAKSVA